MSTIRLWKMNLQSIIEFYSAVRRSLRRGAGRRGARRGPPPSLRAALPPYSRHAQTRQARASPDPRQGRAAGGPSARRPPRRAAQPGAGRQAATGFGEAPQARFAAVAEPHPRGLTGATASAESLKTLLELGDPNIRDRPAWTPHRPPRPDKSEGGRRFKIVSEFEPKGDQPRGDRRAGRGRRGARARPGAARRHRLGQDLHHGQGDRGDAAPGADPRPQQDAGGAALRRVQELLPRQRGRVFRLLLRLLPAGGLRSAHRHLYREGIVDQRADRPHAPRRDARGAGARRRHHRRLGLLHLRHRLGRDLHRDDLLAADRRQGRPAPGHRRSRRAAIQAHARSISAAACSACAATRSSCSPPITRTAPGASASSATRSSRSPNSIR